MSSKTAYRIRYIHLPLIGVLAIASVAVAQINGARKEIVQPLPAGSADWEQTRSQITSNANTPIIAAVNEWKRLQQSDTLGFDAYATFLLAYPGWPGEDRMRRLAEKGINPDSFNPGRVISFFGRFEPRSAIAHARYAQALAAVGQNGPAQAEARAAWRSGAMGPDDENRLLNQFGNSFATSDHEAHADAALWDRNASSAERALPYLSATTRAITEARIALQRRTPDAAAKMQSVESIGKGHAGFIADKAIWLRDTGNSLLARRLLAEREPLTTRPANVEKWYEILLTNARAAANDSQWSTAYDIASKLDDAYPSGTDVSARPIGERDDYTSLAWLAGTTAFYNIGRPREAIGLFDRYASAARSPQTMSKGWYWAGRAALAAGDRTESGLHMTMAASYPDQFYGQLARERLGQSIKPPAAFAKTAPVTDTERSAFKARPLVRAAEELGKLGRWQDQGLFLRAIAASVTTDADRTLANELASAVSRPDLGVMVGRRARPDGSSGYALASFPSLTVPDGHQFNWTMIHAIARQESQFDKAAISHAGARGLMQLMPGTAQETAGRIGLSYNPGGLTTDTNYNMQLGSTYFRRMLDYYNGSYPLAVAAYNAGPGNVNKWLRANGDPRLPGADMLRWIENIPIYETRNYVQRVLENAVVYDAIQAEKTGNTTPTAPLSRYLGKATPG